MFLESEYEQMIGGGKQCYLEVKLCTATVLCLLAPAAKRLQLCVRDKNRLRAANRLCPSGLFPSDMSISYPSAPWYPTSLLVYSDAEQKWGWGACWPLLWAGE